MCIRKVESGDLVTKEKFGDMQLHIEFATPTEIDGTSQWRANSGVLLMHRYEIQVLDSWDNPTYADGQAGAIYGQWPPLVNASKKPGEWQTYDILFEAPKFEGEKLVKPGYVDRNSQRRNAAPSQRDHRSNGAPSRGHIRASRRGRAARAAGSRHPRTLPEYLGTPASNPTTSHNAWGGSGWHLGRKFLAQNRRPPIEVKTPRLRYTIADPNRKAMFPKYHASVCSDNGGPISPDIQKAHRQSEQTKAQYHYGGKSVNDQPGHKPSHRCRPVALKVR